MKTIKQQFNEMNLLPIFEIEVIDKRTGENDYIIFDITIDEDKNEFRAEHTPLTEEQNNSKYISFVSSEIDEDFSLDQNLAELSEACYYAILESEFYELKN